MWTGQEKILGQKVNVKFFTVGPYVPLALVRQTILKKRVLAKYIFLKYQQKTKPPQNPMSSVQNKLILINSTFIDKNKKEQKWALRFQESKSSSKTLTVSQGLSNNYQLASTGFALGALDCL